MDEPRKIVLILGNGFDLDLGLNTSYRAFWESKYCPKDYPAPLIHHLNECWQGSLDKVKWYDLENELFNYYLEIKKKGGSDIVTLSEKKFIDYFIKNDVSFSIPHEYINDASSLLKKGLLLQGAPIMQYMIPYGEDLLKEAVWRDKKAMQLIKKGLCDYLKSIDLESIKDDATSLEVLSAIVEAKQKGNIVSIYTFNYTPLPYGYENSLPGIVHHVHGSCDSGNIIVGTQDSESIADSFDFLEKSMDPKFNPPALVAGMLEADDVIIFGHSIGENDRQYFKSFFTKQTNYESAIQKNIIIFTRDDQSEMEIKRSLQKMTNHNLSTLCGQNHVSYFKTATIHNTDRDYRKFLSRYQDRVYIY